ncbi:hypothetical protein EVAR_53412_1 [Eumeta japonica]|uniref:Uncharacterized protein n=1 Tax=Eumeta variegata TaxID=151549 RepID=A0A4C1XQE2_EUMVA|nr:hypothetical protein EVAR_53412_1 [Eumeta japonica]
MNESRPTEQVYRAKVRDEKASKGRPRKYFAERIGVILSCVKYKDTYRRVSKPPTESMLKLTTVTTTQLVAVARVLTRTSFHPAEGSPTLCHAYVTRQSFTPSEYQFHERCGPPVATSTRRFCKQSDSHKYR